MRSSDWNGIVHRILSIEDLIFMFVDRFIAVEGRISRTLAVSCSFPAFPFSMACSMGEARVGMFSTKIKLLQAI